MHLVVVLLHVDFECEVLMQVQRHKTFEPRTKGGDKGYAVTQASVNNSYPAGAGMVMQAAQSFAI